MGESGKSKRGEIREFWEEAVRLWAESGVPVREFCNREGLATGSDSGDGGIDLLLRREGRTTLVQCKHWKAWRVGVKEVRELRGVVASERAHYGIVATYGSFTEDAIAFANRNPITLVGWP
jgi:restriction system protein